MVRASSKEIKMTVAAFICPICQTVSLVTQPGVGLQKPTQCSGCDNRKWSDDSINPRLSTILDYQALNIQERPEELPPGQMPRSMRVELIDDIVDSARPGDRVTLTGILTLVPKYGRAGVLNNFETALKANHIQIQGRDDELVELDEEDELMIREMAEDPEVNAKLILSMAPSIWGNEDIKEAVLYLLIGGVAQHYEDVKIRGDINILLVGDPGTAKSQMLGFAKLAAPRGLLTTGRGSSAAGLTAAVVKDASTGGFTLEAGALVLADKGVCCIDEIDKMRDEDRGAIHPAMEQQIVPIAKGGIVATLNARASILAAANPLLGRYNPYKSVRENITLPVTLVTRFDMVFILKDTPDETNDDRLATHLLDMRQSGKSIAKPYDIPTLKKYITAAKQIDPIMTDETKAYLRGFYVRMRQSSVDAGAIAITARQLESLVRMAEARARSFMRGTVIIEDAEAVVLLMQTSLEQVGIDVATGAFDIDTLYTGTPASARQNLNRVLNVIRNLIKHEGGGSIREQDVRQDMFMNHSVNHEDTEKLLTLLKRDGVIYSPKPGSIVLN